MIAYYNSEKTANYNSQNVSTNEGRDARERGERREARGERREER